jgi:hypothetical protein
VIENSTNTAAADTIVKAVIYPSIGVARVGNAPAGYVIGPEVTNPAPLVADTAPGKNPYRDSDGRLYPQAARFRIYGVNANGGIVKELTARGASADIQWTVHLANTKAAWYEFQLALDIPEAASADPSTLRNADVTDRASLTLDAGAHTVHVGVGPQSVEMIAAQFMHQGDPVYLGKMWCSGDARLLVTGGRGKSASYDGKPATTFANNDGWHDDVSDGPVTATVSYGGIVFPVTPSWLVVAPPDYGPQCKSVRTMWDLMRDVSIQAGALIAPARPSFTNDIYPVFERMTRLQWVNAGFAAGFGWDAGYDFTRPEWIERLNDPSEATRETKRVLKNSFRNETTDAWSPTPWPWIYGDAMNIPTPDTPRAFSSLTETQLTMLEQWVAGDFESDWGKVPVYTNFDRVPLAEQGDMLTRAALDFCLADAFHPGCEMTWPVRTPCMFMEPFRFGHAPEGWVEPNLGSTLTPSNVTVINGPLYRQVPGGISRWMAVPWQTDTASCRSGYVPAYDPNVPTFWPAGVPNQVMTRENYAIVMDSEASPKDRMAAFAIRASWLAPLGNGPYTDQINNMIKAFDHLGVVEVNPGPTDSVGKTMFPPVIQVEDQHVPIQPVSDSATAPRLMASRGGSGAQPDLSGIDKVRRFPHGLRR